VYLRYHHAVDVFAGFAVAAVAGAIGHALARRSRSPEAEPRQ
jgi:membrane-associated phospholipid phosphatase